MRPLRRASCQTLDNMNLSIRVEPVNHSSVPEALRIHALQMAAYLQEAELIGAMDFPPLSLTVEDLQFSPGQFFGAYIGAHFVGSTSIELRGEGRVDISSFVVAPERHRQGVGRALLRYLTKRHCGDRLEVQTAALNYPAIALYLQGGFVEVRRWLVGARPLELVALRRYPASAQNVV